MATRWILDVRKNMAAVDYNRRLAVSRNLEVTMANVGTRHDSYRKAVAAAVAISKSPLVIWVAVTKVTEESDGVWRNGRKL